MTRLIDWREARETFTEIVKTAFFWATGWTLVMFTFVVGIAAYEGSTGGPGSLSNIVWSEFSFVNAAHFAIVFTFILLGTLTFGTIAAVIQPWLDKLPSAKRRQAAWKNSNDADLDDRGFWFSLWTTLGLTVVLMITSYFDDRGILMPLHDHWLYFVAFAGFVFAMTPWSRKLCKAAWHRIRDQGLI